MEDSSAPKQRLNECLSQIRQIHKICQTPSITYGVIHHGRVIFKQSVGHRDARQTLRPDHNSMYMIGSCSKMFTSAAVGILVEEGKLNWADPIRKYIPEFNPEGNPLIGKEADIIDCLRHSTGITAPNLLALGPGDTIIMDEENLVPLLNIMPTSDEKGQKFNREWEYSNFTYGLLSLVIQRVTGQRFADFVRERILSPLGMNRTAIKRSEVENDTNIAAPCTRLSDGCFVPTLDHSWPCENYSPLLAATGMRSTLNDMLTWCIAVLDAERAEIDPGYQMRMPNNPLKQMTRVRRAYWTRPSDDPEFSKETAYCMGWFRMRLPSSMFGEFSGNGLSRHKEHKVHLQHIIGKDAETFQMIGHTGGMRGSIFSVFTFPETQSAVVTMTNGRDFGDASDFTAQILTQALFDMKPHMDLTSWAKKEKELAAGFHRETIERPWEENRRLDDPKRDPKLYIGDYVGFNECFTFSIVAQSICKLYVIFNHRKASKCPLVFYKTNVYSYLQLGEDNSKMQQIIAMDYKQTLLEFQVNETLERAEGLWWKWDKEAKPAWLGRIDA
ncbi:beta-lactamase/transpeptidase-like protein [Aspergillus cavernicola]|uniref:Beta-lactamase/transpeptidase-like protein n=1 Tax=Aspergillus cavernicola TaxID=176166 RepID=A0ABR4HGC1_9EURO